MIIRFPALSSAYATARISQPTQSGIFYAKIGVEIPMSNTDKKRAVMVTAWGMVKRNGFTIGEALRTAWKNIKLKIKMATGAIKFTFEKADGTIREAWGTLKQELINYKPNGKGRPTAAHLQLFWDVEADGYRCFDKSRLIEIFG